MLLRRMHVNSLEEDMDRMGADIDDLMESSGIDGEDMDEGLKMKRRATGLAARLRRKKAKIYRRRHKAELRRAARKYRRSAKGKRRAKKRERIKARLFGTGKKAAERLRKLSKTRVLRYDWADDDPVAVMRSVAERLDDASVSGDDILEALETIAVGAERYRDIMAQIAEEYTSSELPFVDVVNALDNLYNDSLDMMEELDEDEGDIDVGVVEEMADDLITMIEFVNGVGEQLGLELTEGDYTDDSFDLDYDLADDDDVEEIEAMNTPRKVRSDWKRIGVRPLTKAESRAIDLSAVIDG